MSVYSGYKDPTRSNSYASPAGSAIWQILRMAPLFLTALFMLFIVRIWDHLQTRMVSSVMTDSVGSSQQDSHTSTTAGNLPVQFSAEILYWENAITEWSTEYELDPNLVAVVMQIESCGHTLAQSRMGATGLFQVMPYHFQTGEDPTDPDTNARRGLQYLARSLEIAEGRIDLALAGYNGGHGVINLPAEEWPAETRDYVYWGTGIYADIQNNREPSPTLTEWLQAGGASLCTQAHQAQIASAPVD